MTEELRTFFDPDRFTRARERFGANWGRPLRLFDEIPSTSDAALAEVEGDMKTGGVFVARSQTQGRGRRGSAWISAPGENLTFSLLLRLPVPPAKVVGYSLVVGLAVRAAAERILGNAAAELRVKWPNDVLSGDRKLAGVLVETRTRESSTTAVIGIGINVDQLEFPADSGTPTSLARLGVVKTETDGGKEELLALVLAELEQRTRVWLGKGLAGLHEELTRYDALFERTLSVDDRPGVGAGISAEGALLLRRPDGTREELSAGHVVLGPR